MSVIHYKDYESNKELIYNKFASFGARKHYEVDAYVIGNYPEVHARHSITKSNLIYWENLFSNTRVKKGRKSKPKGFIQINFIVDGK